MSPEESIQQREKELEEREQALVEREKELEEKLAERPFSKAIQEKKEDWFDKVTLTVRQLDTIIYIASAALAIVVVLIILEATGVFKL